MRTALMLSLTVWCLLECSCEIPTRVTVKENSSFSLTGSGRLAIFTVYGPFPGQKVAFPHRDASLVLWQIKATSGYFKGDLVDRLTVTFGKLPSGYTQVVPAQQQGAPVLKSGVIYSFFAETTDAPVTDGYFYVDGERTVATNVPDLCLMLDKGREIRVDCKSHQPYQEPTNVEEFARRNERQN